ncbi:MAG: sensor histidine kinase N-terminal domain-containing protein [Micropruina sp.]|uniref:hypothetical protein n=1 Tax=Micropruina sp. TaxID=2737536 RepID=UPI0039E55A7A
MTSIRLRLIVILLMTTGAVWCCAVFWTYLSTQHQVERVLDARLTEAARMVSSLITHCHDIDVAAAVDGARSRSTSISFRRRQGDYNRQLSRQMSAGRSASASRSRRSPLSRDHASGYEDTVIDGTVAGLCRGQPHARRSGPCRRQSGDA